MVPKKQKKMNQEEKNRSVSVNSPNPYYYGTFQGVGNYYPPPPCAPPHLVVGHPLPSPPLASTSHHIHIQFSTGHQTLPPVYDVVEGRLVRESRLAFCGLGMGWFLYVFNSVVRSGYGVDEGRPVTENSFPCCGFGMGWVLFLIGFFLGGIPWYVGTFIALCVRIDNREKPGYVACVIAAILAIIAVTLGLTKRTHIWF